MKILVYTYGIPLHQTFSKRKEILDSKAAELKTKYPGIQIMVIPGPEEKGDKVRMVDMTYTGPHPAYSLTGPSYPYPGQTIPLTGVGISVGPSGTFAMPNISINPVIGTSNNVFGYAPLDPANGQVKMMTDTAMFKMDAGPAIGITDTNPLGENVVDFKPK